MQGLKAGHIVSVRARRYLVEAVLPPPEPNHETLVRLACLDDDAQGDKLEVLWEREIDARDEGIAGRYFEPDRDLDPPQRFAAWLHTLYWNRVTATDPELFQAPYRAGIQVKDYQLEPLRKALCLPRVNLFIADDVGLGKTIEAGLILREMILRQRVQRVVIAAPPSVVPQWQEEMEQRFGLTFAIYDRDFVRNRRHERGYSINPWTTHSRFIISHALLRDDAYAGPLRAWLGTGPEAEGTLLILDEAHHAAPASGSKYAIDSTFTRIVRDIAHRFEHRLFLSATPHNGHGNSFSALLELLDPQRFFRGMAFEDYRDLLGDVLVRRLKRDLRAVSSAEFPERVVRPLIIDGLPEEAPELELSRLLQAYRQSRETALAGQSASRRNTALLVINNLQKRLLSSIEAFARTLAVHIAALEKQSADEGDPAPSAPARSFLALLKQSAGADDDWGDADEASLNAEEDQQAARATRAGNIAPSPAEWDLLHRMRHLAQAHRALPDARMARLIDWIRTHQCPDLGKPGAVWLPRRLLIFTEYTDTKNYLRARLTEAIAGSEHGSSRIETFQGGLGDERREELKLAFNADPKDHPLRILIATDAAREGVNLQNHCNHLIHFDVPWNPARMEQRNGRIDRKLQRESKVYCHYFVLAQRPEDKVLETLVTKTDTILRELGSMTPVIVRNMDEVLDRGIDHQRIDPITRALLQADRDERQLQARRELDGQLDGPLDGRLESPLAGSSAGADQAKLQPQLEILRDLLQKSREWLHLDPLAFRQALSVALDLLRAEPLRAMGGDQGTKTVWQFPSLETLADAGPGWADTLDTLRGPKPRDTKKTREWRAREPIRPVVFEDPGTLDGKFVHLHLEHRVVQRLLAGLRPRAFAAAKLARATLCISDAYAHPHLLLYSRLALYGRGAARLHDALIAVAARWTEPGAGPPQPLSGAESEQVLAAFERALIDPAPRRGGDALRQRLRGAAAQAIELLDPLVAARLARAEDEARRLLDTRGMAEARAMTEILERQARLLDRKTADREVPADFNEIERVQWQREFEHWVSRRQALREEIRSEPQRVRESYRVHTVHTEPLAIAWLWPVTA